MILVEVHAGTGRNDLKAFFRTDLPSDVEARFIALFKTRARWLYDDLIPFIK